MVSLVNWISTLKDGIIEVLTKLKIADSNQYPIAIALFGVTALVALFIIALVAFKSSKLNKFKKNLKYANTYIESIGIIDEHEVPELYNRIERLPIAIQQGWAKFMDQQVGYPSDYIEDQSVFADKKVDKIKNSGRYFFATVGSIIIFITLFAISILSQELVSQAIWGELVIRILLTLSLPVVVLLFFLLILGFLRKRLTYKTALLFDEFQDLLDHSVTLMREEVPEYVSENMQEINAYIEEILKNKLEDKEIIQLVTTPKVDYADYIEDLEAELEASVASDIAIDASAEDVKEEVAAEIIESPEPIQEEAPQAPAKEESTISLLSEADQRRYLEQLIVLVEMAIKDTKNTTKEDLEDLAVVIATAKEEGYPDKRDQRLLDDCLYMLSDLYYA